MTAHAPPAARPAVERDAAYLLAEKLLGQPAFDPDDDLRVLARQLLRDRDREERVTTFLRERAAWFKYEYEHGGSRAHLAPREEECRWIEHAIRTGRHIQDGRPSWLISSIDVPPPSKVLHL